MLTDEQHAALTAWLDTSIARMDDAIEAMQAILDDVPEEADDA